MYLLHTPPSTRYDLKFTLLGIPVRVHPFFWLMAFIFGASIANLFYLLIWVVVVFVSILAHELGHALAMRFYGRPAHIVLHLAGGLAVPESERWGTGWANVALSSRQEILISLAGPCAGFSLAALVMVLVVAAGGTVVMSTLYGLVPLPMAFLPAGGAFVNTVVGMFLWVNVFWGLINLMPVYPLDGGNITRHLLIQIDPMDGVHKSLWISTIAGAIVAVAGLLLFRSMYIAFLFALLTYESYQLLQGRIGGRF